MVASSCTGNRGRLADGTIGRVRNGNQTLSASVSSGSNKDAINSLIATALPEKKPFRTCPCAPAAMIGPSCSCSNGITNAPSMGRKVGLLTSEMPIFSPRRSFPFPGCMRRRKAHVTTMATITTTSTPMTAARVDNPATKTEFPSGKAVCWMVALVVVVYMTKSGLIHNNMTIFCFGREWKGAILTACTQEPGRTSHEHMPSNKEPPRLEQLARAGARKSVPPQVSYEKHKVTPAASAPHSKCDLWRGMCGQIDVSHGTKHQGSSLVRSVKEPARPH